MAKERALQKNTVSARFTDMVIREFSSTTGNVQLDDHRKKLCQHMFIKIDAQLKELEAKRLQENRQVSPYDWNNINMEKLAVDVVHRVELGLDALIPNHLHPIPYFNKKKGKYDLDLRVGYVGKEYYRRKMALIEPLNIICELVYSSDSFIPYKKDINYEFDTYQFEITKPFDRGEIVGGFGYISYTDKKLNELIIVAESDFIKSKNCAQSKDFWNKNPVQMRYKTLVHRTTEKLLIDPEKVNASFLAVESQDIDEPIDITPDTKVEDEIEQSANTEVIDIPDNGVDEYNDEMTDEEKKEIIETEIKESDMEPGF